MLSRFLKFKNLLSFTNPRLFLLLITGFLAFFVYNILLTGNEEQFVLLAQSFIHGKLYFINLPQNSGDLSFFNNHYFWPAGPFPAILLMPFVLIAGTAFKQGCLFFALHVLNFYLLYKIAKVITKNTETSLWLAFAYIFSTVYLYIGIIPWSWFLAQILMTTLLLLAIYEYIYNKRWLLIGIYLACAILTRSNALFALIFFISAIVFSKILKGQKFKAFLKLSFPVTASLVILMVYNLLRFGNIFERGDSFSSILPVLAANREYGLWSIKHIPANFYYLFLKGPEAVFIAGTKVMASPYLKPDTWGMSIFITSPILLWIFKAGKKPLEVKLAIITSLSLLIFNSGWYSLGFRTYGYRYALDFQPFLYLILCYAFLNPVSNLFKTLAVLSFIFNLNFIPRVFY